MSGLKKSGKDKLIERIERANVEKEEEKEEEKADAK